MFQLPETVAARGTPTWGATLKAELEALPPEHLGLQSRLTHGSHLAGDHFQVMVLGGPRDGAPLRVRIGVFFASIIAGCSCADDPTPVDELAEYCELTVVLDPATGTARVEDD